MKIYSASDPQGTAKSWAWFQTHLSQLFCFAAILTAGVVLIQYAVTMYVFVPQGIKIVSEEYDIDIPKILELDKQLQETASPVEQNRISEETAKILKASKMDGASKNDAGAALIKIGTRFLPLIMLFSVFLNFLIGIASSIFRGFVFSMTLHEDQRIQTHLQNTIHYLGGLVSIGVLTFLASGIWVLFCIALIGPASHTPLQILVILYVAIFIGSFYLLPRFQFAEIIYIKESATPLQSLKESFKRTKGHLQEMFKKPRDMNQICKIARFLTTIGVVIFTAGFISRMPVFSKTVAWHIGWWLLLTMQLCIGALYIVYFVQLEKSLEQPEMKP